MKWLSAQLVGLLFAGAVCAHSQLQKTEPKDGAVLKSSPNEIRMWFSEPLKVALSTVVLRDSSNKPVHAGELSGLKDNSSLVALTLPKLPAGSYKVTWTAVAQDMHVTKGEYTFQISP